MSALEGLGCTLARADGDGYVFSDVSGRTRDVAPGSVETRWFWQTSGTPDLGGDFGEPVGGSTFPGPGGMKFGVVSFPASSDGRMDAAASTLSPGMTANDAESGMHTTTSVDLEIILSGRIVLELPGGESREFGPGESVVLGGIPHRWYNPYDEPCVYAAIILGATGAPGSAEVAVT